MPLLIMRIRPKQSTTQPHGRKQRAQNRGAKQRGTSARQTEAARVPQPAWLARLFGNPPGAHCRGFVEVLLVPGSPHPIRIGRGLAHCLTGINDVMPLRRTGTGSGHSMATEPGALEGATPPAPKLKTPARLASGVLYGAEACGQQATARQSDAKLKKAVRPKQGRSLPTQHASKRGGKLKKGGTASTMPVQCCAAM